MPRIRKAVNPATVETIWRVALYIRLSREDGNVESLSVVNQKALLKDYLDNHFVGAYEFIDYYVDDGMTGTDSERENFQRMLGDIDCGAVTCVIVKDPSRLSRNYIEAGQYMEILFVKKKVRFISLTLPSVDSFLQPEQMNSIAVPIQNVINDDFCRQTSMKIRRTFDYKRKTGQFIGAFAPYGYQKAPDNKNRLIIDENTAPILRDIFDWFVRDGMSKKGIAKHLNRLGIPNPAAYKKQNGMKYHNSQIGKNDGFWNPSTIDDILHNQMYIGHMVQGKQRVTSYKIHTRERVDEKDWFICEDTHEAIIDGNTFQTAQDLLQRDTRVPNGDSHVYLFSGFVRCADCKKSMQRNKSNGTLYYVCRTNRDKGICTRHSVKESVLAKVVLAVIRQQVGLIISIADTIKDINESPLSHNKSHRLDTLLKQRREDKDKLVNICDSLYPDLKNGVITNDEYHRMKEKYMEQLKRVQETIDLLEVEQNVIQAGITTQNPYFSHFVKYHTIKELDRGLLTELVDTIYVHQKQPGEKEPSIEIVFKYADQFALIQDYIESNTETLKVIEGKKIS